MELEDDVLHIESFRQRIHRIQKELSKLIPPGRLLSDELIAERHEEARLELEDFERARELRRIRDGFQLPEDEQQKNQPKANQSELDKPRESKIA